MTVSLAQIPEVSISNTGCRTVGRLDPHITSILHVLQDEPSMTLQAYLSPNVNEGPRISSTKMKPRNRTSESLCVSINLYSFMPVFDHVGSFLLEYNQFLQAPQHCDRNVPYRNPQSLSGRDENPPKTFDLFHFSPLSQVETLAEAADPSALLEIGDDLPESEPPSIVVTPLYKCVSIIINCW